MKSVDTSSILSQFTTKEQEINKALRCMREAANEEKFTEREKIIMEMDSKNAIKPLNLPYSEFSNLRLKQVDELYNNAKIRTLNALKNKRAEKKSRLAPGLSLGQLKPIFPELIEEIKTDESIISSFSRRPNSSPGKLSLTSSNLRSFGKSTSVFSQSFDDNTIMTNSIGGQDSLFDSLGDNDKYYKSQFSKSQNNFEINSTDQNPKSQNSLRSKSANNNFVKSKKMSNNENNSLSFSASSSSPLPSIKSKMKSHNEKIQLAKERRNLLTVTKALELELKVNDKKNKDEIRAEFEKTNERQRFFLIVVSIYSVFRFLKVKVDRLREGNRKWKRRVSVNRIAKWFRKFKFMKKMFRNQKAVSTIIRYVRLYHLRQTLYRKNKAKDLILLFLKDSNGISKYTRQMYSFRNCVIKIQRWTRYWIEIQQTRTMILWMIAEKKHKKMLFQLKARNRKNLTQHIIPQEDGSVDVTERIKRARVRIEAVLNGYEEFIKEIKREEERVNKRNNIVSPQDKSTTGLWLKKINNFKTRFEKTYTLLRDVLTYRRKMFIRSQAIEVVRVDDRYADRFRQFLLAPQMSAVEEYQFSKSLITGEVVKKKKYKKAPIFFLYTKGGIEDIKRLLSHEFGSFHF